MRIKILGFAAIASVLAISLIAAACGNGDDAAPSNGNQTAGDGANSVGDALGAIVPGTFLTYNGQQYELKGILQADLVDGSEFAQAGEASAMDVDGDAAVYTRAGDNTSVYTFFAGSGSGEQAIPDNWYKWEPVE